MAANIWTKQRAILNRASFFKDSTPLYSLNTSHGSMVGRNFLRELRRTSRNTGKPRELPGRGDRRGRGRTEEKRKERYCLHPFRYESRYKEISRGRRRLLEVSGEILTAITVFLAILAADRFVLPKIAKSPFVVFLAMLSFSLFVLFALIDFRERSASGTIFRLLIDLPAANRVRILPSRESSGEFFSLDETLMSGTKVTSDRGNREEATLRTFTTEFTRERAVFF